MRERERERERESERERERESEKKTPPTNNACNKRMNNINNI